jgi:hypothetical protein
LIQQLTRVFDCKQDNDRLRIDVKNDILANNTLPEMGQAGLLREPFDVFLSYHRTIFHVRLDAEPLNESLMNDQKPVRMPWNEFPDVIIHSPESAVKKHGAYEEAKAGDSDAAFQLVQETISPDAVQNVIDLAGNRTPLLTSAHAFEKTGVNAIPEALADELGEQTGFPVDGSIVQINVVGHTGANGFSRLPDRRRLMGMSLQA